MIYVVFLASLSSAWLFGADQEILMSERHYLSHGEPRTFVYELPDGRPVRRTTAFSIANQKAGTWFNTIDRKGMAIFCFQITDYEYEPPFKVYKGYIGNAIVNKLLGDNQAEDIFKDIAAWWTMKKIEDLFLVKDPATEMSRSMSSNNNGLEGFLR